jgi:hypothetical protein
VDLVLVFVHLVNLKGLGDRVACIDLTIAEEKDLWNILDIKAVQAFEMSLCSHLVEVSLKGLNILLSRILLDLSIDDQLILQTAIEGLALFNVDKFINRNDLNLLRLCSRYSNYYVAVGRELFILYFFGRCCAENHIDCVAYQSIRPRNFRYHSIYEDWRAL